MTKPDQTNLCCGRFLFITILVLGAGIAAGCWIHGRFHSRHECSDNETAKQSEKETSKSIFPKSKPQYVLASELGILESLKKVTFPPDCKVRVMQYLWTKTNGTVRRVDYYFKMPKPDDDAKYKLDLVTGIKLLDPNDILDPRSNPSSAVRVIFSGPNNGYMTYWVDAEHGARRGITGGTSPQDLLVDWVGESMPLMTISYQGYCDSEFDWLSWTKLPTPEDLVKMNFNLYATVWVRLEKLSPEDADKGQFWSVTPE